MNAIMEYYNGIAKVMEKAFSTQETTLMQGAQLLCEATINKHNIFAFGCSHASLLALELYYRTGGMANINPIRAAGLNLDIDPATMTSQMERLPDYGRIIVDNQPLGENDVIIIHSVSGRNTVTVDVAMRAHEKGAKVIALTNLEMSKAVTSRHPSGKRLFECADIVIDNCGCVGDASIEIDGVPEKVAPTSTAVGAALLNAMIAEAVQLIIDKGVIPPVFMSANLDAGDEHNRKMLEQYKNNIFYMGFN